jgi:hypothetical protein
LIYINNIIIFLQILIEYLLYLNLALGLLKKSNIILLISKYYFV